MITLFNIFKYSHIFFICSANVIYNKNNYDSHVKTLDETSIFYWDGMSDSSTIGNPYVSHIITNESYFNIEGYVLSGELNFVLKKGIINLFLNKSNNIKTLTNIGERIVAPLQSYINISLEPYSSILCYGAELNLSSSNPYYIPPYTYDEGFVDIYYNTYDNMNFKDQDHHINNGTNNATNSAWNSTWYHAPWLLINTKSNGWIWWHQHPYGVVYVPLRGCIILYCYNDNDDDCYETQDSELRYENLGVVYREVIKIKKGYDECIFGVSDFYINEPLGQPIFYPQQMELKEFVNRPLRSHFTI